MKYPNVRLRRLRQNSTLRGLVSENRILTENLIMPLFVKEGLTSPKVISSMPGQLQWTLKTIADEAKKIFDLGIHSVILFGVPSKKDAQASGMLDEYGVVQKSIALIKKRCPKMLVIADVCLCEYTDHGHCGHVHQGRILNDETLPTLAKASLSYVNAGADMIAPSDMMDGRVAAIRKALDVNNFKDIPIMSYAVKYASAFYSPFRDAAESNPGFGDRASYQMNYANVREALREAETDIQEGADILMVKPALAYLDVLCRLKEKFNIPLASFHVSGEYSMIKAAAAKGWLDEKKVVLETHMAMKRAGADLILTYWAKDIAKWLK